LSKLLDLKRFDTALDFAKANNLSLDLVYSSMVRNCLEKIQATFDMNAATQYEEVVFVEMMRNLRLISDKNNVIFSFVFRKLKYSFFRPQIFVWPLFHFWIVLTTSRSFWISQRI
jgi:hypothetical protein